MTPASPRLPSMPDQLPQSSRYELLVKIASGGMATVYVGRLRGAEGFWRLVAIKRAHPHLLDDPGFRSVVVAEARLASRIHHPNVVSVLDVEEQGGELLLVMDFVEGAALSSLLSASKQMGRPMPPRIAVRTALDAALGLQAAHELIDDDGRPLGLVHRDVSPQNILVGQDGAARISDFGIAKCVTSATQSAGTQMGVLKGKLPYMAPEYIENSDVNLRGDVFALGVVLWETLANERLFRADNDLETMRRVASMPAPVISTRAPWTAGVLDDVLARALDKSPTSRFPSARAFAEALETAARRADLVATTTEVGDYVRLVAGADIAKRRELVRARGGDEAARVSGVRDAVEPVKVATGPVTVSATRAPIPDDPTTVPLDTGNPRALPMSVPMPMLDNDPSTLDMGDSDTSLSTLGRSGVSAPITTGEGSNTDDSLAARRRRARLGAFAVLASLTCLTGGVVAARFLGTRGAPQHAPATSANLNSRALEPTPLPVPPPLVELPAPAPSSSDAASASAPAHSAKMPAKPASSRSTGAHAAPSVEVLRAPPNPYATH